MNSTLEKQRQLAAELTKGISSSSIHEAFERIVIELNLKGDLLDFGAGAGNLIRRFQQLDRFSSITALDIMPCPAEFDGTVRWVRADLNNSVDIAENSFDVIVSSEVIEHLENPRAIAREWFRMLRPGGTLILSTPNNESWRALLTLLRQGHFVSFLDTDYPAHITALVRKDIERMLREAGFASPEFVFTDAGQLPKISNLTWQAISAGLLKGLRYSDNLLAIAQKSPQ